MAEQTPIFMNPDSPKAPRTPNWTLRILIILLLIVLGVGYWFGPGKPIKQPAPTHIASIATLATPVTTITLQDSQALPATVQVKPHTTVTWVNQDKQPHQLAALTAQGSELANFNTNLTLQPGDSYSFVFETAGTYTYHDKNGTNLSGTILVSQ